MPLSSLTKPNYTTQDATTYKANIDAIISEIADEPAVRGITTPPLFNAPFKNSLAFDGKGYIDFTRASTATYIDRYGVLQTAAIDAPRFEKNGLLIEGASTNLLTRSEEFDHADWAKSNATVVANATTAPDGTLTADQIGPTITAAGNIDQLATFPVPDNKTFIFTVWLKDKNLTNKQAVLNIRSGIGNGTSTFTANLTSIWQRFSVTEVFGASVGADVRVFVDGSNNIAGEDFYAWGAQLEELPFASSYIPTVASTVTRSADVCTLTPPGNVPAINQDISVICDVDILGFTGVDQWGFAVSGLTLGQAYIIPVLVSNASKIHADIGGANNFVSGLTANIISRIGVSNSTTQARGFVNGVFESSVARATQTGTYVTTFIGQSPSSAEHLFGHISNLRIYDVALTDDQMRIA